ncbi:MAG: hypothetical protein JWR66_4136 [Modestobacter sp.]|nr:hypothetical protein [Modestobacter sp.]
MLSAARVIAIDKECYRLERAAAARTRASTPWAWRDAVGMEATYGYDLFKNEEDPCEKVVLKP